MSPCRTPEAVGQLVIVVLAAAQTLATADRVSCGVASGTCRVVRVVSIRVEAAAPIATTAAITRLRRNPWVKPAGWASSAPNTAMARAPPSWRLVLNTPLAVPASASGTLFSNTAVIGGITSGPARPTGSISTATVTGAAVEVDGGEQGQAGGHQDESGGDDVAGAETFGDPRAERGQHGADDHHRQEHQAGLEGGQPAQLLEVEAHHERQPVVADDEREPDDHRHRDVASTEQLERDHRVPRRRAAGQ